MNVLLAFAGEAVAIGIAVRVVMWIADRDEEDDGQQQEMSQFSSRNDD